MGKLSSDFPGFAELDAAGEATTAKVRKRIKAGTLTEIPGIGAAKEAAITEAFDEADTPADQGADNNGDDADDAETPKDEGDAILNDGEGVSTEMLEAGEKEASKSGAEKNALANHDLSGLTPLERREAGVADSLGTKLATCGAVFVQSPSGNYASRQPVPNPDGGPRIKVLPISLTSPVPGTQVKDGDEQYVVGDTFGPDAKPTDWLAVRNPTTDKLFIE